MSKTQKLIDEVLTMHSAPYLDDAMLEYFAFQAPRLAKALRVAVEALENVVVYKDVDGIKPRDGIKHPFDEAASALAEIEKIAGGGE